MSNDKPVSKGKQFVFDDFQYHKLILIISSVILKLFLMGAAASYTFCGGLDPTALSTCKNIDWFTGSIAWVLFTGVLAGWFLMNVKSMESVFPTIMRADFLVSAMYLAVAYSAPSIIASKAMIWLYGVWFFAMFLAPFNRQKLLIKKLTEYGGLVSLFVLLLIHFIPDIQQIHESLALGIVVTSFLSVFGAGRGDVH